MEMIQWDYRRHKAWGCILRKIENLFLNWLFLKTVKFLKKVHESGRMRRGILKGNYINGTSQKAKISEIGQPRQGS